MRRAVRFAVLAVAGALALAFAGSALAAYQPRVIIDHEFARPNDGGRMALTFVTDRNDDATAKLTIHVPPGYRVNLGSPGTQIGNVQATIQTRAINPDILVPVTGSITPDSPSNYPTTHACLAGRTPQAVWLLAVTAAGQTLQVPMFVFSVAGGEATFSSLRIEICLSPPEGPGAAPLGARVVEATLTFNAGVFTTPSASDDHMWIVYATPYTGFRLPVNMLGTIQARAFAPSPVTITLRVTFDKRRKQAVLTGRISVPGFTLQGLRLAIFAGPRANRLRRSGSTGRVNAQGGFSARKRIARTTFFRISFAAVSAVDQEGCADPTTAPPAPAGCTAMVSVAASSAVRRAVFRR